MPSFNGSVLTVGSTDTESISAVQAQLTALGYTGGTSGKFDAAMESVVRLFQAQHFDESGVPLKVDGQVGAHTWNALFGATPIPVQPIAPLLAQAIAVASSQVGQMEVPRGSNRGPMVDQYLTATGVPLSGPPDSRAWCMCFVYWSFLQAAQQLHRPSSPLPKTGGCLSHWHNTAANRLLAADALKNRSLVKPGMIFILDFGSGLGHTGIVEALLPGGGMQTLEGNTNTDGSRSGVGVFRLTRRKLTDTTLVGFVDYSEA